MTGIKVSILPRQGEVAPKATEGAEGNVLGQVSRKITTIIHAR